MQTTCAACPYLGKRVGSRYHVWTELTPEERAHGMASVHDMLRNPSDPWGRAVGAIHACYKGVDLNGEFKESGNGDATERSRALIHRARDCPKAFTLLSPSLGAEQHLQAERLEQLEELRRANELKIAELDRDMKRHMGELEQRFQETQTETLQALLGISAATKSATDKLATITENEVEVNERYQIGFLLIAVVALVLALAPLAYPNGVPWLTERAPWGTSQTAVPTSVPSVQSTPDPSGDRR